MIKILDLMMIWGQFLWVMSVIVNASGCIQDWTVVVVVKVTDGDSYCCCCCYYTQNCMIVLAKLPNCKLVVVVNLFLLMVHTHFIIVTLTVKFDPLHALYLIVFVIARPFS